MAKSAAIELPVATVQAQHPFKVVLTCTNGDTDAYVTYVRPLLYPTGLSPSNGNAASAGKVQPSLTSSNGLFVAGSNGTADLSWDAVVFVPQGSAAADQTWVVGATVYWSTGETTASSTHNVTVQHQP